MFVLEQIVLNVKFSDTFHFKGTATFQNIKPDVLLSHLSFLFYSRLTDLFPIDIRTNIYALARVYSDLRDDPVAIDIPLQSSLRA